MSSRRRIAVAWAGPLLIAGLVVFALRGFVFDARLTHEHPDLLSFWLPRWTFLGRTIADGTVPVWNPFEMTGYRFAADPQSGWLYAPPMILFSWLSPSVAMRAIVVLNPLLAGLGLYAFLRVDGLGRVAATVAGVSLAGMMSGSEIAIAMPFAGAVAWSTIVLLGAAGFVRADTWWRRLEWLALAGFAWSQVASAHLSHGLVVGSGLVVAYLVAAAWGRGSAAWGRVAVFAIALPVLSLAILVPRLEFIESSSLGAGYDALGAGVPNLEEEPPIAPGGVWAGWPLAFAAAPGAYAGATALIGAVLALRARRRHRLVIPFVAVLLASWALLLPTVIGAEAVRRILGSLPYGDVLLHNPGRLRYVAVLALPVLAAAGIQGLSDAPPSRRALVSWIGVGIAFWLGVPIVLGSHPLPWLLFAVGTLAAIGAFAAAARSSRWRPAIVGTLVLELLVVVVVASRWSGDEMRIGLEGTSGTPLAFQPLRAPDVDLDAYLEPTPFVALVGDDRYLTWVPPAAAYEKGYLFAQDPADWPALANERGTLFGIRDALGYNPVQLPRYWAWIRATNPLPVAYNASVLARPTADQLRTLGVRYLVAPRDVAPTAAGAVVASAGGYDLVEIAHPPDLVELRGSWDVVSGARAALRAVTSERFEERDVVVLEDRPGRRSRTELSGGGRWRSPTPTEVRINVRTDRRALLLIRSAYDDGWGAAIDGQPVDLLVADAFLQAVAVPRGRHQVVLRYEDQAVRFGLELAAIAWSALVSAWVIALLVWASRGGERTPPRFTSRDAGAPPR